MHTCSPTSLFPLSGRENVSVVVPIRDNHVDAEKQCGGHEQAYQGDRNFVREWVVAGFEEEFSKAPPEIHSEESSDDGSGAKNQAQHGQAVNGGCVAGL